LTFDDKAVVEASVNRSKSGNTMGNINAARDLKRMVVGGLIRSST